MQESYINHSAPNDRKPKALKLKFANESEIISGD